MTNKEEISEQSLEMVARHGHTKFRRAIAVVRLAERREGLNELREVVAEEKGGRLT